MIVLSVLLLPAMVIRFYQGWFQMLYIDVPLFLASTFSISSFYLVSQKELFPRTLVSDVPVSALPDGVRNWPYHHQLQSGDRSPDRKADAPLRGLRSTACKARATSSVAAKKYRKRLGIVPWIELVIGSYFAMTVVYAVQNENYITVPFLMLFVFGYWYTGLLSLFQGLFERAGKETSGSQEMHEKPYPMGI